MDHKESRAGKFYFSLLVQTENLFNEFNNGIPLKFIPVQKMIKMAYEYVRLDHDHIVYVMQTTKRYKNPHVSHAVRATVTALIIGSALRLPRHQLLEVGVACLLGNISVLNLPGGIYISEDGGFDLLKKSSEDESKLLYAHPIDAYNTLKSSQFPLSICEAVLQHHELEDGTGFPNQLKGNAISMYAKILAVAGYYEAFSMNDIEEVRCGHSGVIRILKNSGAFDKSVIRALVNSISIYPIGIYVLLSNGERGQVIEIDQFDPRFPIVKVFGKEPSNKLIKIFGDISITRPLTSEEVEDSIKK